MIELLSGRNCASLQILSIYILSNICLFLCYRQMKTFEESVKSQKTVASMIENKKEEQKSSKKKAKVGENIIFVEYYYHHCCELIWYLWTYSHSVTANSKGKNRYRRQLLTVNGPYREMKQTSSMGITLPWKLALNGRWSSKRVTACVVLNHAFN